MSFENIKKLQEMEKSSLIQAFEKNAKELILWDTADKYSARLLADIIVQSKGVKTSESNSIEELFYKAEVYMREDYGDDHAAYMSKLERLMQIVNLKVIEDSKNKKKAESEKIIETDNKDTLSPGLQKVFNDIGDKVTKLPIDIIATDTFTNEEITKMSNFVADKLPPALFANDKNVVTILKEFLKNYSMN